MRSLAQKMKKLCPVEFLRKSFKLRKSMKLTKEIFGGQIFKRPAFGLRCANFGQIFFKSHVITKYEKSGSFRVPFQFEKFSNCVPKKVRVLRTYPGVDRVNLRQTPSDPTRLTRPNPVGIVLSRPSVTVASKANLLVLKLFQTLTLFVMGAIYPYFNPLFIWFL